MAKRTSKNSSTKTAAFQPPDVSEDNALLGIKKLEHHNQLPEWKLVDANRHEWKLRLMHGCVKILIWDRRVRPILWPWFDGFHCQIIANKTIDIELPGVIDAEEAKRRAIRYAMAFVHQLGSEIGLWKKQVELEVTQPIIIFKGAAFDGEDADD